MIISKTCSILVMTIYNAFCLPLQRTTGQSLRAMIITKSLGVKVYFADPYSSWQKGGIENANGLARQYIPKSETFEHVSHQQITKYSRKLNMRPRKKLDFRTPQECFYEKIM